MIITDTNYALTLQKINEVVEAIENLDERVFMHIPQGVSIPYNSHKKRLLHWLEEMEYTVNDFKN